MFNKQYIVYELKRLEPGKRIEFDLRMIDAEKDDYNGFVWEIGDVILEGIVGSSYEYSYGINWEKGRIVFERRWKRLELGEGFTYLSPDRRSGFVLGMDRIWRRKEDAN